MALFAAEELDVTGTITRSTSGTHINTTWGIGVGHILNTDASVGAFVSTGDFGPYTTTWYGYNNLCSVSTANTVLTSFYDPSKVEVFRLILVSADTFRMQYLNSAVWTNIGGTISATGSVRWNIGITVGVSGRVQVSVDNNPQVDATADFSAISGIGEIRHNRITSSASHTVSEFIWGDEPTVGHRYVVARPTGNGTDTAGTGAFGDVDEASSSDTDFTSLATVGDAETYTHGTRTMPSGVVKAVQAEMRVKNSASGPQNVRGRLRIGGAAYDDTANFAGIGTGYKNYRARWTTNPSGGSWTPTAAVDVAVQFGAVAHT